MVYYHKSPDGEYRKCSNVDNCKFKQDKLVHVNADSKRELQEKIEVINKSLNNNNVIRSKNYDSFYLSNVLDIEELRENIRKKNISVSVHPEDNSLKSLKYSKKAQLLGAWNEVTKEARGIIIRSKEDDFSDAVIVERPFRKFFTLQQINDGWALGDEDDGAGDVKESMDNIDFDAPALVTDKLDGSMATLYQAPDGSMKLANQASFSNAKLDVFNKMIDNDELLSNTMKLLKKKYPNVTFTFELTGQDNEVVVQYDYDKKITMIGAVDKISGRYLNIRDFPEWGNNSYEYAEQLPARTLREALELQDRTGAEGLIVLIPHENVEKQFIVKIKQDSYMFENKVKKALEFAPSSMRKSLHKYSTNNTIKDALENKDILESEEFAYTKIENSRFIQEKDNPLILQKRKERDDKIRNIQKNVNQTVHLVYDAFNSLNIGENINMKDELAKNYKKEESIFDTVDSNIMKNPASFTLLKKMLFESQKNPNSIENIKLTTIYANFLK